MSLAKVIGPDIQELIRENPKELAGAVKDLADDVVGGRVKPVTQRGE